MKFFRGFKIWLFVLIVGLATVCVSRPVLAYVLVFKSQDVLAYSAPVPTFKKSLKSKENTKIRVKNMEGSLGKAKQILSSLASDRPEAIYALGAKAAYVAKKYAPKIFKKKIPVVISSVLNWKKYSLSAPYTTGVRGNVPAQAVLLQTRMVASNLKKIGVIYSGESAARIKKARRAAKAMGMRLETVKVDKSAGVPVAFSTLQGRKIDALWMVADPVVITPGNFKHLSKNCLKHKLPTIVYSENFVKAGGLMSVSVNYETIGSQVASIVYDILSGKAVKDIPVADPIGTQFIGNRKVARKIELDLSSSSQFMDKVIGNKKNKEK